MKTIRVTIELVGELDEAGHAKSTLDGFVDRLTYRATVAGFTVVRKDELVEEAPAFEPQHVGGGYYELSDGTRVKGKDAAIEAQAAL